MAKKDLDTVVEESNLAVEPANSPRRGVVVAIGVAATVALAVVGTFLGRLFRRKRHARKAMNEQPSTTEEVEEQSTPTDDQANA